jgi:aerobic-type carbon monoxide dehydrogenase small subunit (CoxS/CutS family)
MAAISFSVNGTNRTVEVHDPDKPLLYVLRNEIGLKGPKFGCGLGQCGACTVIIDGEAVRSCSLPVSALHGQKVTTIEGLSNSSDHPLQKAWIAEETPQCGYCQSGQIMRAAALLKDNPHPTREQIIAHMKPNICRCGSYRRIIAAIERAASGA